MEKDPICGMTVDPSNAAGKSELDGNIYYFCSLGCKTKFDGNRVRREPQPVAAEYTCPMHPEVVRSKPGACPICGMALEPRHAAMEEDRSELRDMTHRFGISA